MCNFLLIFLLGLLLRGLNEKYTFEFFESPDLRWAFLTLSLKMYRINNLLMSIIFMYKYKESKYFFRSFMAIGVFNYF